MNAKIGAVGAQLLSRDGEVDGLQERVRRRTGLRLGRGRPVPERQESYVFHTGNLGFSCRFTTVTVSRAAPSHRARTRLPVAVQEGDANFGGRPLLAPSGRRPNIRFFKSMVLLTGAAPAGSRLWFGPPCRRCSPVPHLPSGPTAKTGQTGVRDDRGNDEARCEPVRRLICTARGADGISAIQLPEPAGEN